MQLGVRLPINPINGLSCTQNGLVSLLTSTCCETYAVFCLSVLKMRAVMQNGHYYHVWNFKIDFGRNVTMLILSASAESFKTICTTLGHKI